MFDAKLQDLVLSDEIVRYVKIARDALFTNVFRFSVFVFPTADLGKRLPAFH